MGVFKWLRRERVTVTTRHSISPGPTATENPQEVVQVGTIRTEEYKRDLAEFQARRSIDNRELQVTPVKKKCGRHSLPISCTDCATDHDNTFTYEKKSALKYKKKSHKRIKSDGTSDEKSYKVPNIQFLFQNQVFMPGNVYTSASYSEPHIKHEKRHRHHSRMAEADEFLTQKYLDFKDDEDQTDSPPLFFKNNSLPFDVKNFLDCSKSDEETVDGTKAAGDVQVSSHSSAENHNKDDSCELKICEVMSELNHWADEQLLNQSPSSKSDDNKSLYACQSNASACGLPIASSSDVDVTSTTGKSDTWIRGNWGLVPVQVKKLPGVTLEHVRKKLNTEINILGKYRHPNIILLMGVYSDALDYSINLVYETCLDTLHNILHEQNRFLSAQSSVHYALDIANALTFLRMHTYVHTELSSTAIMITNRDTAKLADLSPCAKLKKVKHRKKINYDTFSPEPQYVNIEDTTRSNALDCEPLISEHPSESYITYNSVRKPYNTYKDSIKYNYHAPELFESDDDGFVYPCSKSDVYSLCLILWECCNAAKPWKDLKYEKLKELYILWHTGIKLPQDGTYPGSLLSVLQDGLKLNRTERIDLTTFQNTLQSVKNDLDKMEYIIIPARISKKQSNFSSVGWDTSVTDSECMSPKENLHAVDVHKDTSDSSEKDCSKSDISPVYESIRKNYGTYTEPIKSLVSDEEIEDRRPILKYPHLPDNDFSSACSTPISKVRARIKDLGTPGALHRSDSTEYCSILSPRAVNFDLNDDSNKDKSSFERPMANLSRSFTPKSYKPLHIKVPEFNGDSLRELPKNGNNSRSSYSFDIKNYSLPTTPIARSNKLRRNAWLSGDIAYTVPSKKTVESVPKTPEIQAPLMNQMSPKTPVVSINSSLENEQSPDKNDSWSMKEDKAEYRSPESMESKLDSVAEMPSTEIRRDISPESNNTTPDHTASWSFRPAYEHVSNKYKIEDELIGSLSVKPLVAIHERWIYEANRKTGRSMSLPEDNRSEITAVKPASHCVDTLLKSLPQLNNKRCAGAANKLDGHAPLSPNQQNTEGHWEQFCQARENVERGMNFSHYGPRDERFHAWKKYEKGTITDEEISSEPKTDRATDTKSIEDFIKDLIRKEFQHLLSEITDEATSTMNTHEDILNKGVTNIVESLQNGDAAEHNKYENIKSFSRVKINGNNKPLLQICFSRSGESSLQVLDNCVNITICDGNANTSGKDKLNISIDDTLTVDDVHANSLKRCQAFNALQEARSTEDLYIDDDLSTHMQENFGGKVKLIPLHGSLHEILCEKEDECCLIKVKQENGCDAIYFKCDNSDTESRDAIDGNQRPQDTVVYKRSISLVEERIERIFPREKKVVKQKVRPKSEIFAKKLDNNTRMLSNSSPSLVMKNKDEVEVNIENVMCYQDSSSDECLKSPLDDEFELIERKIEEDLNKSNLSSMTCGCLEKISEENLSLINEDN